MEKRILIVGTNPYNRNTQARALNAYFHGCSRENLAQIFSHPKKPVKGHCSRFYQITDKRMLMRHFRKTEQVQRTFTYAELAEDWISHDKEVGNGLFKKLYEIGSRKNPFIYLARKALWKRRFWQTEELDRWMDEFQPECVFLCFSDDFFIPQIALYAAQRYNIPIISCIGDDYYFNKKFSLSPLYHIYKHSYRKLIRKVFAHGGSAIYISDKIRDKYNDQFPLNGQTVYLSSELSRKEFAPIPIEKPVIRYFGNIRQGRNESLCAVADALGNIDSTYRLEVYSGQTEKKTTRMLEQHPNICFMGSIPYAQVAEKTAESDIVVIVEGFKEKHINNTRYSLSTKAADSLACGAQILVYGSSECGVIEYMQTTESAAVCTELKDLPACIRTLLEDVQMQRHFYDNAIKITRQNHTLESSTRVFSAVVEKAVDGYGE